ncbi:GGDEF domain-containing protein [Thermomonas brevis]
MSLDFPTIAFIGILLYVGVATGFSLLLLVLHEHRVPRLWAAGLWSGALGVVLFGVQPPIPEVLSIFLRNALTILGHVLLLAGVAAHIGRRPPWRAALAVAGAYMAAIVWFSAVQPDLQVRLVLYSAVLVGWHAWKAWLLLRHAPAGIRTSCRLAAVVFLLDAAIFLLRGLAPVSADAHGDILRAGLPMYITYMGGMFTLMAQAFALMLMIVERQLVDLRRLARTDALTGTLNRAALLADGQQQLDLCRRQGRPYSALMLDLDFFKRINDRWGHQTGDDALRHCVRVLRRNLRSYDALFGRYGGEEFVLLLPGVALADARSLAERLRARLAERPLKARAGQIPLTVSIGVAEAAEPRLDALLAQADAALYRAKADGRDRVACEVPVASVHVKDA